MNTKKIIIGLFGVLLLAGGGMYYLTLSDEEIDQISTQQAEAETAKISLDEVHIYMHLEPITATIFRNDRAAGVFTAAVTLELAEESSRTEIATKKRNLRDAMFRELYAMFEREEYTGRKVSVDAVKRRMLVVARRELGAETIVDLYVKTLLRKGA